MHALQETLPQLHLCTVLAAEAGAAELANTAGLHLPDAAAMQPDPTAAAAEPDHDKQQQSHPQPQQLQQQQALSMQEVHQLGLPQEVVLLGIDPDCNGAIAVVQSHLQWFTSPAGNSSSRTSRGSRCTHGDNAACSSTTTSKVRSRKAARSTDGSSVSNSSANGHGSTSDSSSSSNGDSSSSTSLGPQLQAFVTLPAASVRVFDMPVETIITKSKTSTGKARVRR
jgi:hypothetical protein